MDTAETGKAKRRRIALACTQCRSRKTKCNGAQPICSSCASNRFLCVYDGGASGASPLMIRNEDFQALAMRVSTLETELELLKSSRPVHITSKPDHSYPAQISPSVSTSNTGNLASQHLNGVSHQYAEQNQDRERVDGMGIAYEVGQLPAHYGSSSAAYLTEALLAAVPHEQDPFHEPSASDMDGAQSQQAPEKEYPSIQEGNQLLHKFEVEIWPTYPIVPVQLLRDIYHSSQSQMASSSQDLQQLGLLKSMFALSAAFSGDEADGAAYFRSAHRTIGGEDITQTQDSLWQVCSLIYSVLYLQSTERPSPAWHTIGRAIRICLALGYHTDRPHLRPSEEIHAEIACRAWHACLNIDRFVSMSLGRPSSIQLPCPLIRLPKPVQQEAPDQLQYLISCTLLSNILARVLSALYLEISTPAMSDQTRGTYEQDLLFWRHQLPPHLDLRQYSSILEAPQNAVMLALRFHTTYMLLHRFSVQEVIKIIAQRGSTQNTQTWAIPTRLPHEVASSFSCCISAAAETVDILSQVKSVSVAHKGGAAWYRLFYTYNAFTILVTAVLALEADIYLPPGSLPRDDQASRLSSCEECENLIGDLARSYKSARRCHAVVQQLLSRVKSYTHNTATQLISSTSAPSATYEFDFNKTLDDIKKWLETDTHSAAGLLPSGEPREQVSEVDDVFDVFSGDLAWLAQQ